MQTEFSDQFFARVLRVDEICRLLSTSSNSLNQNQPLQTVRIQIRPDKLSGLGWIQAVWHYDGVPERS